MWSRRNSHMVCGLVELDLYPKDLGVSENHSCFPMLGRSEALVSQIKERRRGKGLKWGLQN